MQTMPRPAAFHFPAEGELVRSAFEPVSDLDPSLLAGLGGYRPDETWGIGDAFTVNAIGQVIPDPEVLAYKRLIGWEPVPQDRVFEPRYRMLRNTIIQDARQALNSLRLKAVIEVSHSGPDPSEDRHYDQVPHLDVVSLLGQRVLLYFAADRETTRFYSGQYRHAGFLDDYSVQPDFDDLTEERPDPNQLVRAEGITLLHAGNIPTPHRVFVRAFVEDVA